MTTRYLLGVDIGTYSSKGVLTDEAGAVIASQTIEHNLSLPRPGWAEHDPEAIWWHDFRRIVRSILKTSQVDPQHIAGLGISTISPAVVAVGSDDCALRPAILYGIDTRATEEIAELEQLTGVKLSSQSAAPKVLWIRRNDPDTWQRTCKIVNGSGYLNLKLTGESTIDRYDAAAFSPFFDLNTLEWNPKLAAAVAPLAWMPRPTWTCEIAGRVTPRAADETGLASGTPVITGTADAAAEAISAGMAHSGDLMIMYGSSSFFILKTDRSISTPGFWSGPFLESGTYAVAGGTSTAGSLTRWFRDQFSPTELEEQMAGGENAYTALARLAELSPPGANGLIALPYFYGERTPLNDPKACGMIFGLTLSHTRADFYRALLEGVGYSVRHNLETMQALGLHPLRLLAVGGGAQNRPWMQMVSDIAGITQIIPAQNPGPQQSNNEIRRGGDGASYGDAFLAGVGAGLFSGTGEISLWTPAQDILHPDASRHALYTEYYSLYRQLYENNVSPMHRLADLRT